MKKNLFGLVAFLMISLTSMSSPYSEKFNAVIKVEMVSAQNGINEKVTLNCNFTTLEDFLSFDSKQLNFDDECTAKITVTVSVGVGSTYASATVEASGIPCKDVGKTVKELKKQAKEALQN